ncbi:MAG: hypothetical protein LBQ42_03245 [Synergistaceae bacterium]|nr:hypothetical protein [Synergistaceae bacterium]
MTNWKTQPYPDIERIADTFLEERLDDGGYDIPRPTASMPSLSELKNLMHSLRALFFPGFFSPSQLVGQSLRHQLISDLDRIFRVLAEQIRLGICFSRSDENEKYGNEKHGNEKSDGDEIAFDMASDFMKGLPAIRDLLASDVLAAYEGDPAAKSKAETIFCYPSVHIMTNHRVAHRLYNLSVPVIPRIISEMAHSRTGIDIHPGASIDEEFFIDHGTGVVIGETSIIGKRCKLYRGVTLGALSFPKNSDGTLIKGLPRHPILEDGVTVYSGATILGRVTIGAGSLIGGNVWITSDIPPGSKVAQQHLVPTEEVLLGETR